MHKSLIQIFLNLDKIIDQISLEKHKENINVLIDWQFDNEI